MLFGAVMTVPWNTAKKLVAVAYEDGLLGSESSRTLIRKTVRQEIDGLDIAAGPTHIGRGNHGYPDRWIGLRRKR